jgi:hypothetical protein
MPILTPNWLSLQQRLDQIVDDEWAEVVEIHPWATPAGGFSNEGGPDPTRPVLVTVGMYVTAGAAAAGEVSQGMSAAHQIDMDVWLSVQQQLLGNYQWVNNDRVFWPWRSEWYQISYSAPSASLRPNIHLIRLNNTVLQSMIQQHFGGSVEKRLEKKSVVYKGVSKKALLRR